MFKHSGAGKYQNAWLQTQCTYPYIWIINYWVIGFCCFVEQPLFLPPSSGLSIFFRLPFLHGFALAVSTGPEVPPFSLTVVAVSTLIPCTYFQIQIYLHLSRLIEAGSHIFMWVSRVFTGHKSSNFSAVAMLEKVSHTSCSWRYGKWIFSKSVSKNWCKASTEVSFLLLVLQVFRAL